VADLARHFAFDIGHNDRTSGIDPLRDWTSPGSEEKTP